VSGRGVRGGRLATHLRWRIRQAEVKLADGLRRARMHVEIRPSRFGAFGPGSRIDPPARIYGDPAAIHIGANVIIGPRAQISPA